MHMDHSMMTPSVVRLGIVMKWSAIEEQSERGQNKSSVQNRVTSNIYKKYFESIFYFIQLYQQVIQ